MKGRLHFEVITSTLVIMCILLMSSTAHITAMANQTEAMASDHMKLNHYYTYNSDIIRIFYNDLDENSKELANSLFEAMSKMTPSISMAKISDTSQVSLSLTQEPVEIAIYVFPTDVDGFILNRRFTPIIHKWTEISDLAIDFPNVDHILATGNTKTILSNSRSNIHGSNQDQADAHQLFVYTLWTTANILENSPGSKYTDLGKDIRMATLDFFANNFNGLVKSNISPTSPMGQINPTTIAQKKEQYINEHQGKVERLVPDGYKWDEEMGRVVSLETNSISTDYPMDLISANSMYPSDFNVKFMPKTSGLRGPIGGIVDAMLPYLLYQIGDSVGLSMTTVDSIVSTLDSIPELIGLAGDPSASALRDLIESIKPMLPIPSDQMGYVDLLVNGLFALRGDTFDISSFINSTLPMLLPTGYSINGQNLSSILSDYLAIGSEVVDEINSGADISDYLVQYFNERMLENLTRNVLHDANLGLNDTAITMTTGLIGGVIAIVGSLATTGNIDGLIHKYGPKLPTLLQPILGTLNLSENQMGAIMSAVGILLVLTGTVDGPKMEDLLVDMLTQVTGLPIGDIRENATALISDLTTALNVGVNSVSDFQNNYLGPTLNLLVQQGILDVKMADAIMQLFTLIMALSNQNFSLGGITNSSNMILSFLNAFGVVDTNILDTIDQIINLIFAAVDLIYHPPNFGKILSNIYNDLKSMVYDMISFAVNLVLPGTITLMGVSINQPITPQVGPNVNILNVAEAISLFIDLMKLGSSSSIESLFNTLLQSALFLSSILLNVDIKPYVDLVKGIFGTLLGLRDERISQQEVLNLVLSQFSPGDQATVQAIIGSVYALFEIFTGGYRTVISKITEWLVGKARDIIQDITAQLDTIFSTESWPIANFPIPLGFGDYSLFTIDINIGIKPGFKFREDQFSQLLIDLVLDGSSLLNNQVGSTLTSDQILKRALSFLDIYPVLTASFDLTDFGATSPDFFSYMMDTFGLELAISGSGAFEMSIFSFENGGFNYDAFFEIISWSFRFDITVSKSITLLDLLTGGAGGALRDLGEYIGLDSIRIDIWFSLAIEIVKRAASAIAPETSSLTLIISFGFALVVDIDIIIAVLNFNGSLEISFSMIQDLSANTPMQVYTTIVLTIDVFIAFAFWDWDWHYEWSPSGYSPKQAYSYAAKSPAEALASGAKGGDSDNDGLSDDYEAKIPGLNPNSKDSDGDTLDDKLEIQVLGTNPTSADTDNDGLLDAVEFTSGTNPKNADSDFDRLSDYEELVILGTNANSFDTDHDGLDDYYEVTHSYNMTGITPSVTQVIIGGVAYTNRTDPLVADTDHDGLLDGSEGIRGIYYGPSLFDFSQNNLDPNAEPNNASGVAPIIKNNGFTHPLDNDTDDDSYMLNPDGSIASPRVYLRDMSDYTEIYGMSIVFYDPDSGQPLPAEIVRTNPVSPDSDIDTPLSATFMLSDGYELTNGPTDPLNGDTDNDGLMDGLEGFLLQDSNHTDPRSADTDGDGLGDLQELQLGSNPLSSDSDRDGVSDSDEFFVFGTNLFLADTDSDGISDGDELWFFHTSPFLQDTDGDGISDYSEIFLDLGDPNNDDADHDFLTDFEENFIYFTNPWEQDGDHDGLLDGEEIQGLPYIIDGQSTIIFTDPTKADTDSDSILWPNAQGQPTISMNDGEEYLIGTNPTSSDTDSDGISDAWEIWLGQGEIPNLSPISLNPLSNDTDGDTILDGNELIIANMSTLLNPYIGHYLIYPFNTMPDKADTDSDGLNDAYEVEHGYSPINVDTDLDTISDYDEEMILGSNPRKNDTDGDGLPDQLEFNGYDPLNLSIGLPFDPSRVIHTSMLLEDTDGDLLPDGAEIMFYGRDPNNSDENQNGIIDGMDIDTDQDGLYDGEEFYVYMTAGTLEGGGITQPDSDRDGLLDGREVNNLGTLPNRWDSDNDTFSDGIEIACKTDPLDNTTVLQDFASCFGPEGTPDLILVSPSSSVIYATQNIPVIVYDSEKNIIDLKLKYKQEMDAVWSNEIPLTSDVNPGYWKTDDTFNFGNLEGGIVLEITGKRDDLSSVYLNVSFSILPEDNYFYLGSPIDGAEYFFSDSQDVVIPVLVEAAMSYSQVTYDIVSDGSLIGTNMSLPYNSTEAAFYSNYQLTQNVGTQIYSLTAYGVTTSGKESQLVTSFSITVLPPSTQGNNVTSIITSNGTTYTTTIGGSGGVNPLIIIIVSVVLTGAAAGGVVERKRLTKLIRRGA